jgi:hypothetical protein
MVMEAISPQSVGREFVRQYYTLLNKAPLHLHRFYSGDSSFVHGGLDKEDKMLEPVHGQQEIHEKIMQLNFRDCKAKIRQVDAHATLASGVVVQVLGELSNNHQPMRRFMQTFVLAPQTPKKFYVYNDIFRYQDEVFNDLEDNTSGGNDNATTFEGVKKVENVEAVENEKNFANDGIATVSIIDGVQKEPHLNGGGSSGSTVSVNELSPRVPVEVSSISVTSEPEPLEEPAPVVVQEKQQKASDVTEDEKPPKTEVFEPENTISSSEGVVGSNPVAAVVVVDEKPSVVNEASQPPVTPAPASSAATATSVTSEGNASNSSSSNEKPTYANLFKKSGGPLVASGPISLPPAGFSKATATSAASSQPSAGSNVSGSSATTAATAATSAGTGSGNANSIATSGGSGNIKEGSPVAATVPAASAGFHGGKQPFRGQGTRGGGRGGLSSGNPSASRDRYHPSRESVSSNVGEDGERGDPRGSAPGGSRGGGSRIGMNSLSNYPDSHQIFVGDLPHYCQEHNLEDLFSKFGKVVDVRINTKGVAQSKNLPDSQKAVPNFGFVVFEDEKAATECLSHKPINLPNGHRLNVETKKKNNRDDGKGGFGGSAGGANRGQGSGSNFDRGSQEQLGGLGRGGLNSNSRGNPRGGARGSGRGGFSGGRGGGSGPPPQGGGGGGGASIPGAGNNAQPRTTYTRRS